MTRFLIYLFFLGGVLYLLSYWARRQAALPRPGPGAPKQSPWLRVKKNPRETWVQVYETATLDEARGLQARLEEQEVECIVYEQGKKDIYGNALKGVGVAVPKTSVPRAQSIISRMPI